MSTLDPLWANISSQVSSDPFFKAKLPGYGVCLFAAICCFVFIVTGVTGNSVTVAALWRHRGLRAAPNTAFVLNLAVVDLVFCALNLPITAVRYLYRRWVFGEALCRVFPLLFYGNVGVSVTCLACIAASRWVLVFRPALYQQLAHSPPLLGSILAGCWAFGLGMLCPPLFRLWGQFGLYEATFSCTILPLNGKSPKKFLFCFAFLFPIIVIIIFNSCIFYKVRQSSRALATHTAEASGPLSRSRLSQRETRMTLLMFLTFLAFVVCFLPLTICNLLEKSRKISPDIHVLASILSWMSSCINPFLYVAANRQYRRAILSQIYRRGRYGPQTPSTGSTTEGMGTLRMTAPKRKASSEPAEGVRKNSSSSSSKHTNGLQNVPLTPNMGSTSQRQNGVSSA